MDHEADGTTAAADESSSPSEASMTTAIHAAAVGGAAATDASVPAITLLIENPGKGKNWGPLLRCCAAFGVRTIYVVGYDRCDVRGSHGASKHVELVAFPTHEQAFEALTKTGSFELVGLLSPPKLASLSDDATTEDDLFDRDRPVVRERFFYEHAEKEMEIVRIAAGAAMEGGCPRSSSSFPVHLRNRFPKRTCLVVDKLRRGLPWSLAKHCSSFVHISHANLNAHGSMLTLEASVSIVFYEAMAAGLVGHVGERTENATSTSTTTTTDYRGQKYHVEKVHKGTKDEEARQRKRKEREDKQREMASETVGSLPSFLFGGDAGNDDGDY